MRIFAQRSSGVLGGLCFYENFRTEKQRGFGGTVLVSRFAEIGKGVGHGACIRFADIGKGVGHCACRTGVEICSGLVETGH